MARLAKLRSQIDTCMQGLKRRRWALVGVMLLLAGIPCGLYCFGDNLTSSAPTPSAQSQAPAEEAVRPVKTVRVRQGTLESSNTYPGSVRASKTAKLAFRVGGPLIEVRVKPGDAVSEGDVLMRIDPRDFDNQVKATKSALEAAQAKLSAMKKGAREEDILAIKANLLAATARRDYARSEYERFETLVKQNAVSRSQFENTKSQLDAAEAQLDALEQELAKADAGARIEEIQATEAQIRGLETQLRVAEDQLEDTTLRAPFDGVITKQPFENFEQVNAGDQVLAMHNISVVELDVNLPMKEVVHRDIERPFLAQVRFRSNGEKAFQAEYYEIDTEADPLTRTYKVTFRMTSPRGLNILPGMTADVTITSCSSPAGDREPLLIPSDVLFGSQDGKQYAWVVGDDSTVQRREVTTGPLTESDCYVVLQGLDEGDEVVASGVAFLHDGMAVRSMEVSPDIGELIVCDIKNDD